MLPAIPDDFELLLQTSDHYNFAADDDDDWYDSEHDDRMVAMTAEDETFLVFSTCLVFVLQSKETRSEIFGCFVHQCVPLYAGGSWVGGT